LFTRTRPLIRIGHSLLLVALALFWWMQKSEPGMHAVYAPISLYARLQHGWILCVALLSMSLAIVSYALAYKRLFPKSKGVPPLVSMSVAIALAAIFRAHTYFPWDGPPTVVGTVHMFFSVCGFLLFGYAALIISAERQSRILKVLTALFWTASAFTCADAAMTLLLHQKPQYLGLEERLIMLVALIWFFVLFPASGQPGDPSSAE
jgi:hypothetical membrane protein